jgi:salicylate hydroxylase
MHAIIVGAGIGGVAAALCLIRQGIKVTMLEQAGALREIGAGIQISSNGSRVLSEIGVLDQIDRVAVKPVSFRILSYDTGELITDMPLGAEAAVRYGYTFYQVHRADLLDALAGALPAGVLRLHSRVDGFSQDADGVTVSLESGATVRGDLLIGADGIHSVIRHKLLGQEDTAFSGKLSWRALVPAERIKECNFEHRFYGWTGIDRMVFAYWVRAGQLFNFGGVVPSAEVHRESWEQAGDVAELKKSFKGVTPQLQKLVDAIDEASITGLFYKNPLSQWSFGRVTLLGDAAHAMLPYMAQGACQSLEDGLVLALCLARHGDQGIPAALSEYELKRRPRTTKVQSSARAAGLSYLESNEVQVRARNGRFRGLAQVDPLATTVWGWVYFYDAKKDGALPFKPEHLQKKKRQLLAGTPEEQRAWNLWAEMFTPEDEARGLSGLRQAYDRLWLQFPPPPKTDITEVTAGSVPALWVTPPQTQNKAVVLHLHGGGFAFGSAKSSVEFASRLANAVGGRCLVLDYRLAPEHPFPAALNDALEAYRWLLRQDIAASEIFLSGESAGAGLALAAAMSLRDDGDPLPAGIIAVSPLVDLTLKGESIDRLAGEDPIIDRDILTYMATSYFQGCNASNPLVSPLYGRFEGLPPLLVQAGRSEVLVSDATRLAEKAQRDGVDVTLDLYDERLHIFPLFPFLPKAAQALARMADFAAATADAGGLSPAATPGARGEGLSIAGQRT